MKDTPPLVTRARGREAVREILTSKYDPAVPVTEEMISAVIDATDPDMAEYALRHGYGR